MAEATHKLREYQALWLEIARADAGAVVKVRCSASYSRRLIQAVRKEKSISNSTRKNFDMPRYGKLLSTIDKVDNRVVIISFQLTYNGDQL